MKPEAEIEERKLTDAINYSKLNPHLKLAQVAREKSVVHRDNVRIPTDEVAAFISDPDNRKLVTVVATINYGCKKIPPMIVIKGAYNLRKYFDNDMDGDILLHAPNLALQMIGLG